MEQLFNGATIETDGGHVGSYIAVSSFNTENHFNFDGTGDRGSTGLLLCQINDIISDPQAVILSHVDLAQIEAALKAGLAVLGAPVPDSMVYPSRQYVSNRTSQKLQEVSKVIQTIFPKLQNHRHTNDGDGLTLWEELANTIGGLRSILTGLDKFGGALHMSYHEVHIFRGLANAHPQSFSTNLAMSLTNLAERLRDLKFLDEASASIKQAIDLYDELTPTLPHLRESLALSLKVKSECCRDLHDPISAQEAIMAAIQIQRSTHDAGNANLLSFLNHSSACLRDLHRYSEASELSKEVIETVLTLSDHLRTSSSPGLGALSRIEEAVSILEALDSTQSRSFEVELVLTLNDYSERLSSLGRRSTAFDMATSCVVKSHNLASHTPMVFDHILASSLRRLSMCLSDIGQRDRALEIVEEAVQIGRRLATYRPKIFEFDLAEALSLYSRRLMDVGRYEDAQQHSLQAVAIYRRLGHPGVFEYLLVGSLKDSATCLACTGKYQKALTEMKHPVFDITQNMTDIQRRVIGPELVSSLHSVSAYLGAIGQRKDALMECKRALEFQETLKLQLHEDVYDALLGDSYFCLSGRQADLGLKPEALKSIMESVGLFRRLAGALPDVFSSDLARCLSRQSQYLTETGNHLGSQQAAQEAVDIQRDLGFPDVFGADLASFYERLADVHTELGHHSQAIEAVRLAVGVQARAAHVCSRTFKPGLARLYNILSRYLRNRDEQQKEALKQALDLDRKAVSIQRALASDAPELHSNNLAIYLDGLSLTQWKLGDVTEAIENIGEALALSFSHKNVTAVLRYHLSLYFATEIRFNDARKEINRALTIQRALCARDTNNYEHKSFCAAMEEHLSAIKHRDGAYIACVVAYWNRCPAKRPPDVTFLDMFRGGCRYIVQMLACGVVIIAALKGALLVAAVAGCVGYAVDTFLSWKNRRF
ncbi:hypothetical protein K439DRAFT_1660338 [Ramaria rubella]|nr:hypothetical protein K439DRAFT_1660338 [Ramaria rubella]